MKTKLRSFAEINSAIAKIQEFEETYEHEYKDLSDIEALLEAAIIMVEAYVSMDHGLDIYGEDVIYYN